MVVAQKLASDSNPDNFRRRILLSAPESDRQHLRYRKFFLVKSFIIATSLKSRSMMPQLVEDICNLLFSKETRRAFGELIEAAKSLHPSKAAISRSRVLLDGIFMLYSRRRYSDMRKEHGCVRYIMLDSSRQHDSEFEAMFTMCIPKSALPRAMMVANNLINLRMFIF